MKYLTIILLVILSNALSAQKNGFDNNSTEYQRQQDLLKFIESDIELYSDYKNGKGHLKIGKTLGYISLTSVAIAGISTIMFINAENRNWVGPLFIGLVSSGVAAISGSFGILHHITGKGRIRNAMNRAENQLGGSSGVILKLQTTSNGIGLVFSF